MKIPPFAAVLGGLFLLAGLVGVVRRAAVAETMAARSAVQLASARDSLKGLSKATEALTTRLSAARGRVDTLWRVRSVYVAQADTSHRSADSAYVVALRTDTGAVCRPIVQAYQLRTTECAQLREAVAADSDALRGVTAQLDTARSETLDERRTVGALRVQLGDIAKPYNCHVWFVGCPSRLETAILSALAGFFISRRVQ